jgi:molecular chaperone DnaK
LGRFILDGIPSSPRGIPQIEVTFDIDANGILTVKAKDKATNKEQMITIKGAVGLSDEEIKQAQAEAEKYAQEDQQKKEQVEARNQADNLVFSAEKTLKDAGDKVKPEDKEKVEAEVKNVKEVLAKEGATKEEIQKSADKLSEEIQKVGASLYQSQQQPGGQPAEGETPKEETAEDKTSSDKTAKDKDKAEEGEVVE